MNEQATGQFEELYDRAMCLGYTSDSAAQIADCAENFMGWSDPCAKHPNHSVSMRDGYAVDDCEACEIITKSDAEGWFPGKWAQIEAKRAAEHIAYLKAEIVEASVRGECSCWMWTELGAANLSEGGEVCLGCGSIFTPEGTEASAAVLALSEAVIVRNQGTGVLTPGTVTPDMLCADGKCGQCPDCVAVSGVVEDRSGIDALRELVTLDTAPQADPLADMVKFHRLSPAMMTLMNAVYARGGCADAWQMRNDIASMPGVTSRTRDALIKRGILTQVDNQDSGYGQSFTTYVMGADFVVILAA